MQWRLLAGQSQFAMSKQSCWVLQAVKLKKKPHTDVHVTATIELKSQLQLNWIICDVIIKILGSWLLTHVGWRGTGAQSINTVEFWCAVTGCVLTLCCWVCASLSTDVSCEITTQNYVNYTWKLILYHLFIKDWELFPLMYTYIWY